MHTPSRTQAPVFSAALVASAVPVTLAFDTNSKSLKAPQVGHGQTSERPTNVDLIAVRGRVEHETVRTTLPAQTHKAHAGRQDPEESRKEERKVVKEEAPTPQAQLNRVVAPERPEVVQVTQPAPPPAAFEPMMAQMVEDASLRVSLSPNSARVSVETADSGRVHVQIKMTDGVAEVKATGPGAAMFEQRQGELRVAFAREGLAMGQFDFASSGQHGQPAHHERFEPEPGTPRRQHQNNAPLSSDDGHMHVKA